MMELKPGDGVLDMCGGSRDSLMVLRPLQNAPFCPISAPALWNAQPIPLGAG